MVTIESHFRVITRVIHVDLNRIENLDSADLRFFKKYPISKASQWNIILRKILFCRQASLLHCHEAYFCIRQ